MSKKKSSVSLRNVTKSFSQGGETSLILDGVQFAFQQGVSYAITGVSGAGKSTLIHIIAGIETPDFGSVFLNEQDTALFDSRTKQNFFQNQVGLVFQSPYLIEELSVIENVMIKGIIAGQYDVAFQRALLLLEKVGLQAYASSSCKKLSGGEQQRVAVARALFSQPAFLLADEPTAHLDKRTAGTIIDLLLDYQREWNTALIIASHDPAVAQKMDVVLTLEGGRLHE